MKYNPSLDGIRALAILLVMAFHARVPFFTGGYIGVDIFFVLSGFLITSLLLNKYEKSGAIDFKNFYIRRALRLVPALFFMLAVYLAIAPFILPKIPFSMHFRDTLLSAFYLSNHSKAFFKMPLVLSHTWSLSTEELFYLIWPVTLLLLLKTVKKKPAIIILILFFIFTNWRILSYQEGNWSQLYFRFDTHLTGLIFGAFLSLYYSDKTYKPVPRSLTIVSLAIIISTVILLKWKSHHFLLAGVSLIECSTAVILLDTLSNKPSMIAKLFAQRIPVHIGKLSYGLYLWHYPIMYTLRKSFSWEVTLIVGGALSYACALFSYVIVENFFYRLFGQKRTGKITHS